MAGLIARQAVLRGLLGGNRNWLLVWGVVVGLRLVRRITADKPEVLYRHKLEPGAGVVIRNGDRPVTVVGEADVRLDRY